MHKRTVIYRGSLKSCNYSCSYCPFAKHRAMTAEMEKDRQNFIRFCDSIEKRVQDFSIGAVFVTPYGEASIHRWYWEGLSRLAELPGIDRVGMQTNLSFSLEECLGIFDSFGENDSPEKAFSEKKREKFCIWATFHPEMTTVDAFAAKCHRLVQNHVNVCAGAVGVPENIQLLRELREKLSPAVYLWINRMDGLKRNYRPDEFNSFVEIDPFFEYELNHPEADPRMCADRCFVEADGKVRSCNISRIRKVNWYESGEKEIFAPVCSSRRCTCYLAYGGRDDFALKNIFGDYPIYRIPKRFKAAFFDLEGTLISAKRGKDAVSKAQRTGDCEPDVMSREQEAVDCEPDTMNGEQEAVDCEKEAMVCEPEAMNEEQEAVDCEKEAMVCEPDAMSRGQEAGDCEPDTMNGARKAEGEGQNAANEELRRLIANRHGGLSDQVRRKLIALKEICPIFLATSMPETDVKKWLKNDMDLFQGYIFASGGYLCLKEKNGNREKIYSIDTGCLSEAMAYGELGKAKCRISLKNGIAYKVTLIKPHHSHWKNEECSRMEKILEGSGCRFFIEGNCLEIISMNCDKGTGIEEICNWLEITAEDALAVGNDMEDDAMERVCGGFIKVELGRKDEYDFRS